MLTLWVKEILIYGVEDVEKGIVCRQTKKTSKPARKKVILVKRGWKPNELSGNMLAETSKDGSPDPTRVLKETTLAPCL